MSPKVDPNEVRFSNSTIYLSPHQRFLVVNQAQLSPLPLNSALLVWYILNNIEC